MTAEIPNSGAPYAFTVELRRDGRQFQPVVTVAREGVARWQHVERASHRLSALADAAGWLHFLADEIERAVFDESTFPGMPCDPPADGVLL